MAQTGNLDLDAARRPAIWLVRSDQAVSRSKLGGLPDLPPGVPWPRQGKTKTPLHFLAQIDLAALPAISPTPGAPAAPPRGPLRFLTQIGLATSPATPAVLTLPPRGLLFFFADVEEEMLWDDEYERGTVYDTTRVLFSDSPGAPVSPPSDIPQIGHAWGEAAGGYANGDRVYPEAPLEAYPIDSFVGLTRPRREKWEPEADARIVASIERATGHAVPTFASSTRQTDLPKPPFIVDWGAQKELRLLRHQMLGAPLNVNMDADSMVAKGEVLLLQLEPDFSLHGHFVGGGTVQFWIKAADLAARRFERAYATYRN